MVVQRREGVTAKAGPAAREKPKAKAPDPQPAAVAAKRKLSFKDKHALETLPATMDKLTADIARIQEKLSDPALYTRDPAAFAKLTDAAGKAQADLAAAEEEWLRLEMLREEIEG